MLTCPHCGEEIDTYPDPGGSEAQDYIEDCSVCCKPIRFVAVREPESDEFSVKVFGET